MVTLSLARQEAGVLVRGLGLSGALLFAGLTFASSQVDTTFRAETLYLGRLAALVSLTVAAARRPAVAVGCLLLALVAAWALPGGTLRSAAVAAGLALTFVASLWPGAALAREAPRVAPFFVAVAAEALLQPRLLLTGGPRTGRLVAFVLVPAFAALVWWGILPRLRGLLPAVSPRLRALAAGLGAALAFTTAALASLPWLRPHPLADTFSLLAVRRAGVLLVDERPVVLSLAFPSRNVELAAVPTAELIFDTHLAHGAELAAGTVVARFELLGEGGTRDTFELLAGRDTGEWAAARSDVHSAAPTPFRGAVAEDGTFFAQTYRAHWRLSAPRRALRLRVTRSAELPAATELAFLRAELLP